MKSGKNSRNTGSLKRLLTGLLLSLLLAGCAGIALHPQMIALLAPLTTAAPTQIIPSETPLLTLPTATAIWIPTATHILAPTPTLTATATPEVYAFGPSDFPEDVNPLTGLPATNPELLNRRPMVIKVTNFPRSVRPQWGLSLADHVYEYYIGDSMSRFIGVFYGKDASRVGPIRSARIFDEHVMRMYKGIFVFGYADDPVLAFFMVPELKSHLVVERPDNCPPVCRIGPKYAYNNLYTDTSQLSQYITDRGTDNSPQDLTGLRFELDVPKSGQTGQKFSIQFSKISYNRWEYDPVSGRYLRFQETQDDTGEGKAYAPLIDSLTERQLSADNVVVLRVPQEYFYKSTSTEIFDQPVLGSGGGYAFRDGEIYPITWIHPSPEKLFKLVLPNGSLYPLKPGTTWFEIIGETSGFEPQRDGSWNFEFKIP